MMALCQKCFDIFLSFGKIGILSFGGGNSMIKMLEFEVVTNRAWLSAEEFSQVTGSSFLFPGLTAVKISSIIGFKVGGIMGATIAFLSMNLPGILLAVFGFYLLKSYESNPSVKKLVTLVQYGAISVLMAAAIAVATPVLKNHFSILYLVGAIILLMAMILFDLSPFLGILLYIGLLFFF